MKFLVGRKEVAIVYVDQRTSRECHLSSLKIEPRLRRRKSRDGGIGENFAKE